MSAASRSGDQFPGRRSSLPGEPMDRFWSIDLEVERADPVAECELGDLLGRQLDTEVEHAPDVARRTSGLCRRLVDDGVALGQLSGPHVRQGWQPTVGCAAG